MITKATAVLLIAIGSACFSGAAAGGVRAQDTGALADTHWRLVEFQSMDDAVGTTRPDDPDAYTLALLADGSVRMRFDCNHGSGRWQAGAGPGGRSGRFRFEPLTVTDALCPPPSMGRPMAAQAPWIRSFLLRGGRLYLSLFADGGILEWEPVEGDTGSVGVPAAPDRDGPRNWEVAVRTVLNLRARPSTDAPVLSRYPPGTLLDNLGCRWTEGRSWCDVQELGGGRRGYVAAEYLRPAVSPDGSASSGPDDSALRAGRGEFDATGFLPCGSDPDSLAPTCEFGVARAGGGYATVVVDRPSGGRRAIYFRMGIPIGADVSEAEGSYDFQVSRWEDVYRIQAGVDLFEVPDAVVLGG